MPESRRALAFALGRRGGMSGMSAMASSSAVGGPPRSSCARTQRVRASRKTAWTESPLARATRRTMARSRRAVVRPLTRRSAVRAALQLERSRLGEALHNARRARCSLRPRLAPCRNSSVAAAMAAGFMPTLARGHRASSAGAGASAPGGHGSARSRAIVAGGIATSAAGSRAGSPRVASASLGPASSSCVLMRASVPTTRAPGKGGRPRRAARARGGAGAGPPIPRGLGSPRAHAAGRRAQGRAAPHSGRARLAPGGWAPPSPPPRFR